MGSGSRPVSSRPLFVRHSNLAAVIELDPDEIRDRSETDQRDKMKATQRLKRRQMKIRISFKTETGRQKATVVVGGEGACVGEGG